MKTDKNENQPTQPMCDPATGVCELPSFGAGASKTGPVPSAPTGEVLYVGDPMCSWCWGGSPGLRALQAEAEQKGLPFRILVGGLRAGGGDPWNAQFKSFLRGHWEEIAERTGQPFSTRFLDREQFNYDTEPSCRAFMVLRGMLAETESGQSRAYDAFADIQRKFYAENEDPTVVGFYESLCAAYGLDFAEFRKRFESDWAKRQTADEFREVRALGVNSFPTVLYRDGNGVQLLARGYVTGPRLVEALARAQNAR